MESKKGAYVERSDDDPWGFWSLLPHADAIGEYVAVLFIIANYINRQAVHKAYSFAIHKRT